MGNRTQTVALFKAFKMGVTNRGTPLHNGASGSCRDRLQYVSLIGHWWDSATTLIDYAMRKGFQLACHTAPKSLSLWQNPFPL
jgi:hypothetical protein